MRTDRECSLNCFVPAIPAARFAQPQLTCKGELAIASTNFRVKTCRPDRATRPRADCRRGCPSKLVPRLGGLRGTAKTSRDAHEADPRAICTPKLGCILSSTIFKSK